MPDHRVYAKCESCGWDGDMKMIAYNLGNTLLKCVLCQSLFWQTASFPTDVLDTRWF